MQEQGVGAEGAGQMFDAYRRASSGSDTENGRRVQFNQSERDELQKLAQSTGIDEAQSRRSMDQARAANPLLAQVSRTLEEIRDRLPSVPERQTEAAKAEAQNRSLGQIADNIMNLTGVPTGEE
jgi:hypothetical protein